jgi:aspartyl-tRNA(Asn)/glutamyl-tRNA(Gln) amidotransferase subunit C
MTKEEIIHLAALARLELTPAEIEKFTKELSAILSYVGTVQSLAAGAVDATPRLGDRFNVLRTDAVTNEPEQYTKDILAEMPETEGRYMVVKKILQVE